MAAICPSNGEVKLLTDLLSTGETWLFCLTTTDLTPADADSADKWIQAEASGAWYARKQIPRVIGSNSWLVGGGFVPTGGWTSKTSVAGAYWSASPPLSWTYSGADAVVYGYFVLGSISGLLLFCERFASPPTVKDGQVLSVIPQIQLA